RNSRLAARMSTPTVIVGREHLAAELTFRPDAGDGALAPVEVPLSNLPTSLVVFVLRLVSLRTRYRRLFSPSVHSRANQVPFGIVRHVDVENRRARRVYVPLYAKIALLVVLHFQTAPAIYSRWLEVGPEISHRSQVALLVVIPGLHCPAVWASHQFVRRVE